MLQLDDFHETSQLYQTLKVKAEVNHFKSGTLLEPTVDCC